ncbi:hypothetical protein [Brevundimonas sp. NIBR11]|uniref:hypothetical protein n=1 Tax=Brevundimonas sp. NIBR11 TaxID=3015999 RepID=UPI0022F11C69|nr:hypothetical protein [Brevundimonas sp. NIBR11]WGM30393.1 hypothetical protein KKHFBJBL_00616 [Brevundimonas sp. NIBR11]
MLKPSFIAALAAVIGLATTAFPAFAQDAGSPMPQDPGAAPVAPETPNRAPPLAMSGPGAIAVAQRIATAAGNPCRVTEANVIGQTTDRQRITYEVACAAGPGYIFVNSVPPEVRDCILLAGQAEANRAADPNADVGVQCVIPQNRDVARAVSAYAAEAGITCTVDEGAAIGRTAENTLMYEVGCDGLDGYRIEKTATGWSTTECAIVASQNSTCRFSTPEEAAATLKARLAGSAASACDVAASRYMGSTGGNRVYEAKCGAGNGFVVLFSPRFEPLNIYPCEQAQRIGGGCRLTTVAAAPQ